MDRRNAELITSAELASLSVAEIYDLPIHRLYPPPRVMKTLNRLFPWKDITVREVSLLTLAEFRGARYCGDKTVQALRDVLRCVGITWEEQ